MKSERSHLLAEESLLAAEQPAIARSTANAPGLIDVLARSVSALLAAPEVNALLPQILDQLARLLPLRRLTITEMRAQAPEREGIVFHWQASPSPEPAAPLPDAVPSWLQALTLSGQLPEWLRPLSSGNHVLASHAEASEGGTQVASGELHHDIAGRSDRDRWAPPGDRSALRTARVAAAGAMRICGCSRCSPM